VGGGWATVRDGVTTEGRTADGRGVAAGGGTNATGREVTTEGSTAADGETKEGELEEVDGVTGAWAAKRSKRGWGGEGAGARAVGGRKIVVGEGGGLMCEAMETTGDGAAP